MSFENHDGKLWYRGTEVSPSSQAGTAFREGKKDKAELLAAESEHEFRKTYPMCTKEWFERMNTPPEFATPHISEN